MQHKITKFILSASLLAILAGCGSATKFQKKDYMGVFRDDKLAVGFKLDEKFKDWEIREGIPEAVVACRSPYEGPSDKFRENFSITTGLAVATPAALDEIVKELTTELPNFKLLDKHQDDKSTNITFTYTSKDTGTLRARTYFLQTDSSPIRVTFTSTEQDFDRWLPSFEALLADIKIHAADLPAIPTPTPTPIPGAKSGTATPAESGTPAPSGTPAASATPAASSSAAAAGTPAPTATPAATLTPAATSTPAASSKPSATSTP